MSNSAAMVAKRTYSFLSISPKPQFLGIAILAETSYLCNRKPTNEVTIMSKTVVVYGSTTGTCESIANTIGEKLNAEVINVSDLTADALASADHIVLGTSTWGAGELQDDWYDGVNVVKSVDLSGKTVAVFGCGDSASYPDTFCGGMKELYDAAVAAGATLVGAVPTDGYTFDDSDAVVDGKFVGLALDDVNEDDKTEERINAWIPTLGF